jgi:Ser/Thr protein kinase RdoA (MazF antagonist)
MGLEDRYFGPISPAEAARVCGRPVEIVSAHLRWLFAVALCRADGEEFILKRQPPLGRDIEQLRWQHRLTGHLADRGVPAARLREIVELDGLWYEIGDVAAGRDVYAGVDTWEPFRSDAHVAAAGRMLARLHAAGGWMRPAVPQPQAGFVVQIDLVRMRPSEALGLLCDLRPAVADYLAGEAWGDAVDEGYGASFDRLRPLLAALPRTALHGDWQTNNLFFEGDQVSGIIDFHQADHGPRVLDLAVAVERNCFFWNRISDAEEGAYDLAAAARLITAYRSEQHLTPDELAAFADVLAICQFEYGISFLDYYWGLEGDRPKADWAWHTFVLGHARWWQGEEGRRVRAVIEEIVRV